MFWLEFLLFGDLGLYGRHDEFVAGVTEKVVKELWQHSNMTLIVAAGNPHFVAQLSDRRLTTIGGTSPLIITDESNKATVWEVPSGRFLIGYNGITSENVRWNTHFLINELLLDLAPKYDFQPFAIIQALSDGLGKALSRNFRKEPKEHRRLTIMFTGLLEKGDGVSCSPVQVLVTNYQEWGVGDSEKAWDQFKATFCTPRSDFDWPTIVQRVGAWMVVEDSEREALRELLKLGIPPRAVLGKMVSLLPGWSARSGGTVGLHAHSLAITADRSRQPIERYHSEGESKKYYWTSRVITTPQISIAIGDPEIKVHDSLVLGALPATPHPRYPITPRRSRVSYHSLTNV